MCDKGTKDTVKIETARQTQGKRTREMGKKRKGTNKCCNAPKIIVEREKSNNKQTTQDKQ
jgi:hypothetical protein